MTTVYDQSGILTGTDDGNGNGGLTLRVLVHTAGLATATGTTATITIRFGTLEPAESAVITAMYCGQSAAASLDYTNVPSRVTFGGLNTINGSAAGVVTSDVITLPEAYDHTKGFLISFDVAVGKNCNFSVAADTNTDFWFGSGANASNQLGGGLTISAGSALFLQAINIQGTDVLMPQGWM